MYAEEVLSCVASRASNLPLWKQFCGRILAVPIKPKFTDRLISGKGLPEVTVEPVKENAQPAEKAIHQTASSDIPSGNSSESSLLPKQPSLDSDVRPTSQTPDPKKLGGDLHPNKISDTGWTVKEPDSPSHSEIDKVRLSGKKKSGHSKTHKNNGKSPKEGQRKGSLSDLASVATRIKRKFSKSDADNKDKDGLSSRHHVGKATFYNSESQDSGASDHGLENSSSSGSDEGARPVKKTSASSSTFYVEQDSTASPDTSVSSETKQQPESSHKVNTKVEISSKVVQKTTVFPSATMEDEDNVYEPFEFNTSSQDVYENAEVVSNHKESVKIHSVPKIEVQTDQTGSDQKTGVIGPSQDYLPMNLSGGEVYENVDHGRSKSSDTEEVYDNAEFKEEMYDNSVYAKRGSVYEAIKFHRARELKEISRRSKFRTAKRKKATLLQDDVYEPASDKQAHGECTAGALCAVRGGGRAARQGVQSA